MIIDLAAHRDTALVTDVLIVGGGIAGLLLAAKLRRLGVRVVVVESGGREQTEETHPLNRVVTVGDQYRGAMHGRFRCLGGTSTRWGGALIPFLAEDVSARPHVGLPAWPVSMGALEPYLVDVEKLFRVEPGSYDEAYVHEIGADSFVPTGDQDFTARFAKWPQFKRRNVATLLKDPIEKDPDLAIWINATATHFELDEQSRLRSLTARHHNGNAVKVKAAQMVLCAGAIESTRLLLLLDRGYGGNVFKKCEALGHFFHDHISAQMATINAKQVRKLNRMAGIRFNGSTIRSLRFELSPRAQASEGVTSAFGHISFRTEKSTGFDELRDLLRSLQRSGRVQPSLAARMLRDLPYLAKAGLWRYFYKQLYWPVPARYELHVVAEQHPRPNNYIELASETDVFGLPLAAIKWRIESADCRAFSVFIRRFDCFWKRHGFSAMGDLEWSFDPHALSPVDLSHGGDIYHPGGSTRMGTDHRSAVVDENLRTFAVSNLWVLSTSVFPSGASANPTLMLMLFAMRLADKLATIARSDIA
jgi:2-polyprenyl-6-methoxyphenol hydroxylase-like FAD-dependent oxidoreductase